MSDRDSVAYNDDPTIVAKCRTPKQDGIQEILFMPSTGECLFIGPEHFLELYREKGDDGIPNLGESALEEIGKNTELSEKEKAEEVNKILFDSRKTGESQIGEAIKFAECIDLGDKKPIMVAKKFIEKLKKDNTLHFKLVESTGTGGEDIFKDFRIEVESETKKGKKNKILDKKIDTKLRSALLEKFHPRVKHFENKIKNGKSENELSDKQKKQLAEAAKTLLSKVRFPEHIQKFIDGLQVELIGEWEKTYSVWKGERNWNNEESKKQILIVLQDPEILEEDPSLKKRKFNQDDADYALRAIKDLWYTEEDPSVYNDIMTGVIDSRQLYAEEDVRNKLINRVKQAEVPPALFEASTSAAVMRMTARAEGSFKSDITKGQVIEASGKLSADMALAEGKANMKFQLPDENGFNAVLRIKKKEEKLIWHELPADNSDRYPANFHFDSSFVAPHTAHGLQAQLVTLSQTASAQGGQLVGLDIIGHTDAVGAASYNQALGMRRAESAYDFLQEDYVGLAHNFQKGKWNKTHVEFMQAVVHVYNNKSLISSIINKEFPSRSVNLKEALRNPDSIYSFTNCDNTLKLEEHHEFLKQNYPDYKSYASEKVNVGIDINMPNFRMGLSYINGYSNDYILGLLKEYRQCMWPTELNIDLDKAIRYRDGIISKGEQELKIDTQLRNEANRRVVLKGYLLSPQSKSTSEEKSLDFGYFRMNLEGYASGYAGANITLSGTANLSVDPENLLLKGIVDDKEKPEKKKAGNEEDKDKEEKSQAVKAETEAKAEFFAGVKAEAGLKALLFWHESKPKKQGWWELGSVGYAINGSAGLSAEAEFKIGYDKESGRFIIKASASATLGVGGGGKVEFSVGLGGLWKFVQYVYTQIKENDFAFVDFFEEESVFTIFIGWHVKMLQEGINLAIEAGEAISDAALEVASKAQEILSLGRDIVRDWKEVKQEREEAIALVEAIENHDEMLQHATPEVKGRVLYLLTQHRTSNLLIDVWEGDFNHESENAAVKLIQECIVSKRDWQETFEHMAIQAQQNGKKALPYLGSGEKGTTTTDAKLKENQKRMEENEIWLKTYLLNDADDWAKVIEKRNDLWK